MSRPRMHRNIQNKREKKTQNKTGEFLHEWITICERRYTNRMCKHLLDGSDLNKRTRDAKRILLSVKHQHCALRRRGITGTGASSNSTAGNAKIKQAPLTLILEITAPCECVVLFNFCRGKTPKD